MIERGSTSRGGGGGHKLPSVSRSSEEHVERRVVVGINSPLSRIQVREHVERRVVGISSPSISHSSEGACWEEGGGGHKLPSVSRSSEEAR